MLEERLASKAVCLKGEVFVFGGSNDEGRPRSVEKYSPVFKKWVKIRDIPDERKDFCACAFLDKIFLVGAQKMNLVFDLILKCQHGKKLQKRMKQDMMLLVQYSKKVLWFQVDSTIV